MAYPVGISWIFTGTNRKYPREKSSENAHPSCLEFFAALAQRDALTATSSVICRDELHDFFGDSMGLLIGLS